MNPDSSDNAKGAPGSRMTARIAVIMALTESRGEEQDEAAFQRESGYRVAAVDFGGEFISSVSKMVERTVVAARREGVIEESHSEVGAMAGAAREAISQITSKAIGFNVGGKIGIARYNEHVAVCVYFGIGLLHLNEVAIGLGHRVI